jgi:hypothetical protein
VPPTAPVTLPGAVARCPPVLPALTSGGHVPSLLRLQRNKIEILALLSLCESELKPQLDELGEPLSNGLEGRVGFRHRHSLPGCACNSVASDELTTGPPISTPRAAGVMPGDRRA